MKKADAYTRKCGAVTKAGTPCRSFALRDSDPPRCLTHSLTDAERRERAQKGARKSALVRRAKSEPRPSLGLGIGLTADDVLGVVAEGLKATYADVGLPNEADWPTRLLACFVIVSLLQRSMKKTPEEAQAALERALPASVGQDPEAARQLKVGEAFKLARREWNSLRLRYSKLVGLYTEEYPPGLIAPWEDRAKVLREERPVPIPPREADELLMRVGEELYLPRPGSFPLAIPED